MAQKTTMADVAREAGVSLMTVSRVINNKDEISEDTRQRVQKVITRLGYRPSGIARSLAGRQTYTIGLIVPDIANPYFSGIAQGVATITNAENFSVLLCDCDEDPDLEITMLDVLDEKRVDGVIVAAPRTSSKVLLPALAYYSNIVIINRLFEESDHTHVGAFVLSDNELGGYLITQCLISHRHSRIGFLGGPKTSYGLARRMEGYKKALAEAGLEFDPEIIRNCAPTVEGGKTNVSELLSSHPDITALFCFNDLVAIGAIQQCHQLGLRIPDDLAIFGYDDIPMATWITPSLSTCQVNFEQIGREAAKLLINRISNCDEECENIIMQPKLIIRDSAP
ncbi:MAG: LacI family DNA-binding transcriptional regulator [Chloroflexota bacterium]